MGQIHSIATSDYFKRLSSLWDLPPKDLDLWAFNQQLLAHIKIPRTDAYKLIEYLPYIVVKEKLDTKQKIASFEALKLIYQITSKWLLHWETESPLSDELKKYKDYEPEARLFEMRYKMFVYAIDHELLPSEIFGYCYALPWLLYEGSLCLKKYKQSFKKKF